MPGTAVKFMNIHVELAWLSFCWHFCGVLVEKRFEKDQLYLIVWMDIKIIVIY